MINDTVMYKKVMEYLGITMGNLINTNEIANQLRTYYRKADDIITLAVESYFINKVRPYFKNRKNEIVRSPNVYFEETGMRNFLIKNMNTNTEIRNDFGALVENFVYNELISVLDIFSELNFRRTKSETEIDFLLHENQTILPIEVKSGSVTYIPKALYNFCINENISKAVVFTSNVSKIEKKDSILFYFVPFIFAGKLPTFLFGNM